MDMQHRLVDVDQLRCKALQDYIKMVIHLNWKDELYNLSQTMVAQGKHDEIYRPILSKMKDGGKDNFGIEDMDATSLIASILYAGITTASQEVKGELHKIRNDRNNSLAHMNYNEPEEELCLRAIISLLNLKDLIKTIGDREINIDEVKRNEYRKTYTNKIEELKNLLYDEFIDYVGMYRKVERDVKKILDRLNAGGLYRDYYLNKLRRVYAEELADSILDDKKIDDKKWNMCYLFNKMLSDAGVDCWAHSDAARLSAEKGDTIDLEKRLNLMLESNEYDLSESIIEYINIYMFGLFYMQKERDVTEGMLEIIKRVIERGHVVKLEKNGIYDFQK